MSPRRIDESRLRHQVAQEAAKLMSEGLADLASARRKAAARLGVRDPSALPRGDEIRAALLEHRRLFQPGDEAALLSRQRAAALEAMAFFKDFHPRLVGPVLDGSADERSAVILHLHSDDPESLLHLLRDQRIPAEQHTRRLQLERGQSADCPAWEFRADGIAFELVLLPAASQRQAPWDGLDDRPLARASASALRSLLGTASASDPT